MANYFKTNFAMVQHHHWGLEELENLIPWERHVYVQLLHAHLKDEAEQRALLNMKQQDMKKRAVR